MSSSPLRLALLCQLIAILLCTICEAQNPPSSAFTFEASPSWENGAMPYRLFKATGHDEVANQERKYPLILWLHGVGERGDNNTSQMNNGVHNLASAANQAYDPAFLMVPQLSLGIGGWSKDFDAGMMAAETRLFLAIEDLKSRYRIDPDRIYVIGLSMGGNGTWNFITRYPGYFAAAVPMSMSSTGGALQDALMVNMPIWAACAADDTSYYNSTTSTVNSVRGKGGRVIFRSYNTGGHSGTTWGAVAGDRDMYKWMMAQRRLAPVDYAPLLRITTPSASRGFTTSATSITLGGTATLAATTMSGFNSLTWRNTGSTVSATGTTTWSAGPANLNAGVPNFFQVIATAENSNVTRAGFATFNDALMVNDVAPPVLTVLSPTTSGTYTAPTDLLTIRGEASDNMAVTRISWSNNRGGSGVGGAEVNNLNAGKVNWFISKLPIQLGHNLVTITAHDLAGNTTAQTFNIYRSPGGGGEYFRQEFSASTVVADYATTSKNPPGDAFYEIAAAADGGTWSINNGALRISRTSGVSATAALLRRYELDGPPQGVMAAEFDITVASGSPSTSSAFASLSFGYFLGNGSATQGVGWSVINTELSINGAGADKFTLRSGSGTSPSFNSGAPMNVKWFINSSGVTRSYLGPDGVTYSIEDNRSDVWANNVRVITNAAKNGGYLSRNLGYFRFAVTGSHLVTLDLDNLVLRDFPIASPFAQWLAENFKTTEISDPAITGENLDLDGDGIPLMMEFALDGDPSVADSEMAPALGAAGGKMNLTFTRPEQADITFEVEASDDLADWDTIARLPAGATAWSGDAEVTETASSGAWQVEVADTEDIGAEPARYLRLRAAYP